MGYEMGFGVFWKYHPIRFKRYGIDPLLTHTICHGLGQGSWFGRFLLISNRRVDIKNEPRRAKEVAMFVV